MRIDLHELRKIIIEALLNAYDVLGVKHGASDDEIKAAWKKLALQNHPDRGGSHGKMVDINNAKDRLLNKNDLFRHGATIKGYEDANAPQMQTCPKCGRDVAIKDSKFINHYSKQGGPDKCSNSGTKAEQSRPAPGPSSRNAEDDFWNDRQRWRQPPPPPPPNEDVWRRSRSRPGYDYNTRTGQYRPSTGSARPGAAPPPGNAAAGATNKRYFEFRQGHFQKFWEIETIDYSVRVRWGRIGTQGATKTKSFGNLRAAVRWRVRMINSKVAKGYVEVRPAPGGAAPPPQPPPGQARAAGAATGRPTKDSYKVYGWRQGRRVVRVGGKLYGTGQGGRVGNAQTRFNANDRAQVTRDGERMKVKKPDSDHTQTWDPIDEVRQIVDNMVIDMLVEIAHQ